MPPDPPSDPLFTERGSDALHDAARALGVDASPWPNPATPTELAEWLGAREASDAGVARVLACARIAVRYREAVPACVELAGQTERALPEPKRAARSLEAALAKELALRGYPPRVRVTDASDARGARLELALPSRWMRVETEANGEARAFRSSRAEVRYAPGGRLRITAERAEHASIVAAAAGSAWLGDARFFRAPRALSLGPLQRVRGPIEVPREHTSEVTRMRLIDFDWDSGHALAIAARGSDVTADVAALGLRIDSGRLHHGTLRVEFTSAPHRCDAILRAPNELVCTEPSREPLVRAVLESKRVLTYAEAPVNLWSLDPWTPSDGEARAFFGASFDALVQEGVLARSKSRAVAHPEHPAAGRVLIAFPIPGDAGSWYGVSESPHVPSRVLSDADRVTWRIKLRALGARIGAALRARGTVRSLGRRGVMNLGTVRLGRVEVRLFLITRAPADPAALAERLRIRAMPGHAVLFVPPGRSTETGLPEVELAEVAGPYDNLLPAVARALGLEEKSPLRGAPSTARFIVHRASRRVWFDRVLVAPLPEQAYKLAEILAESGGQAMTVGELGQRLSPKRLDDAIARQAKRALLKAIEASFAREKRALPADVGKIVERVRKGEVRLGVEGYVG